MAGLLATLAHSHFEGPCTEAGPITQSIGLQSQLRGQPRKVLRVCRASLARCKVGLYLLMTTLQASLSSSGGGIPKRLVTTEWSSVAREGPNG